MRRFIYAVILLIGLALALSQFSGINRIAASLLASGVVAAAIIGFAARQTLANFVAGVMLAITQPIRVGDWVEFDDNYGVVEDVRLNYTILRAAGEQRILIPNERLASGVMKNDTLTVDAVGLEVDVWIPPGGGRRPRRRGPRRRGRRRASRRRCPGASGWPSAAGRSRRPSAAPARPRCARAATRACARRGCWRVSALQNRS